MEFAEYLPFWNKLTEEQKQRIANVIEFRQIKKDTHIHDSSADCLGLVVVRSGQLRAYILSEDGREITISMIPTNLAVERFSFFVLSTTKRVMLKIT